MKPRKLKLGATIGIVAPASPSEAEDIDKAFELLQLMGYKLKIGQGIYMRRGYLAGEDAVRARDINDMFSDKGVDAIFCLRGGYGSQRILDKIDYDIIRENPKIFLGYSDITAIHNAIYQCCGLVTFHGPMLTSDMAMGVDSITMQWFKRVLCDEEAIGEVANPAGYELSSWNKGRAQGVLVGGNLSMLAASMGTKYEIDTKDKLLFIEDIGEEPYRIDRMLNQLRLGGKLSDASGFILCDFNDCHGKREGESLSLETVFRDMLLDLGKPIVYGYKVGHCKPQITIPIGVKAEIDADSKKLIISEAAVLPDADYS